MKHTSLLFGFLLLGCSPQPTPLSAFQNAPPEESVPAGATRNRSPLVTPRTQSRPVANVIGTSDAEMVAVPAGSVRVGATDLSPLERPVRDVSIDAFEIDRTEVTAHAFAACVDAGVCSPPTRGEEFVAARCSWGRRNERPALPVNCVRHSDAAGYCAHVGKRLPTEYEWEFAARGSDFRKFPWGNDDPDLKGFCGARGGAVPCAVATTAIDESPFGVRDMAGNLREWTASRLNLVEGRLLHRGLPPFVVKGEGWLPQRAAHYDRSRQSAWDRQIRRFRTAFRGRASAGSAVGFRCAR